MFERETIFSKNVLPEGHVDCDPALGCLYRVKVGYFADVSEAHAASISRVEVIRVGVYFL
jgi:hypothetical protein